MTASAPPLVDVIAGVLADTPYESLEDCARAVLAAISEAGAVEWGVQLSESFMENHHGSRRGADEAAKETGSHVITRVTLPWERAE